MAGDALRLTRRALATAAVALAATPHHAEAQEAARDPLPSWRDGPNKRAILTLVRRIVRRGTPDYVPPAERVAVFDNDGARWGEHQFYPRFASPLHRLRERPRRDPGLAERQPLKAAIEGD